MRERSVNSTVLDDDGEQIIVQTNYRVLLKHMLYVAVGSLLLMVCALGTTAPQYSDPSDSGAPIVGIFVAALVACVATYLELLASTRFVRHNPALLVNVYGITDRCSRFVFGTGLIRWHTIVSIEQGATYGTFSVRRYLAITLVDDPPSRLSQPLSQDGLETDSFPFKTHVVRISQRALGIPVADFLYEFERYLDVYLSPDGQDDEEDDDFADIEDEDEGEDEQLSDNYSTPYWQDTLSGEEDDDIGDDEDTQLPDNYSTPWSS